MNHHDVRETGFVFGAAPYRDGDELPARPVCANCRGNIERGAERAGRMCHVLKGEITDEACVYCGSTN